MLAVSLLAVLVGEPYDVGGAANAIALIAALVASVVGVPIVRGERDGSHDESNGVSRAE